MEQLDQKQATSLRLTAGIAKAYQGRLDTAVTRYSERLGEAFRQPVETALGPDPLTAGQAWADYLTDLSQRWVLFLDTLRERGNDYVEHTEAGMPPLLHFDYELLVDGRELERPVNYALVRIIPPTGVTIDPKRRPYVIIDPRAGHGPGIGGFKDDSQVGVALEDGHPVYFVVFFPEPEPGQTLIDVCCAERQFIHTVRERHPDSAAPVVIGNCQGGWAAMMLAASAPEETGPIVVNGAPLSYWGGAWSDGSGDNPMRYSGGLLGGSWLASFASDLGGGLFDGADLVQNFENLNPGNTYWGKYYNLLSSIDSERERFLEFERWWGGFYLLNKAEIEWIVQNLFVGNRLAEGEVMRGRGESFDLREIRSPIVVFASLGDNITPPQQAFNWIADLYGSTEEIKARGQVIVGLLHEDVGHLGIFVSGKVARREHKQIVSVLKSIEALPPGLWGMEIHESVDADNRPDYQVTFVERRLEEVIEQLNRFERHDEKAFEAVAQVSEFYQRAYDLFARPLVKAFTSPESSELARHFHPLRLQRWGFSDLNPWTCWLRPAARLVEEHRTPAPPSQPLRKVEKMVSESIVANLDLYRDLRDAASEALFFGIYGQLYNICLAGERDGQAERPESAADQQLPWVREALEAIDQGGYADALARTSVLLRQRGKSLPLSFVELRKELAERYAALMPEIDWPEMRVIRGRQELIVAHEPEVALATLPTLLADPDDRDRFLELLGKIVADPDTPEASPSQREMVARIRGMLVGTRRKREAASDRPKPKRAAATPRGQKVASIKSAVPRGSKTSGNRRTPARLKKVE